MTTPNNQAGSATDSYFERLASLYSQTYSDNTQTERPRDVVKTSNSVVDTPAVATTPVEAANSAPSGFSFEDLEEPRIDDVTSVSDNQWTPIPPQPQVTAPLNKVGRHDADREKMVQAQIIIDDDEDQSALMDRLAKIEAEQRAINQTVEMSFDAIMRALQQAPSLPEAANSLQSENKASKEDRPQVKPESPQPKEAPKIEVPTNKKQAKKLRKEQKRIAKMQDKANKPQPSLGSKIFYFLIFFVILICVCVVIGVGVMMVTGITLPGMGGALI